MAKRIADVLPAQPHNGKSPEQKDSSKNGRRKKQKIDKSSKNEETNNPKMRKISKFKITSLSCYLRYLQGLLNVNSTDLISSSNEKRMVTTGVRFSLDVLLS